MDLIDIFRTFYPNTEEYTFFSSAHGNFSRIDHILYTKQTSVNFSSVQLLSCVRFFVTPWTTALQDCLSITNSQRWLKLMLIESVLSSSHLILCRFSLLLPSILPSIKVFSNESALGIRGSKYWHISFSISLSNEYSRLISFRID